MQPIVHRLIHRTFCLIQTEGNLLIDYWLYQLVGIVWWYASPYGGFEAMWRILHYSPSSGWMVLMTVSWWLWELVYSLQFWSSGKSALDHCRVLRSLLVKPVKGPNNILSSWCDFCCDLALHKETALNCIGYHVGIISCMGWCLLEITPQWLHAWTLPK